MYLFEEEEVKRVYRMTKVVDRSYKRTKKLTDYQVSQIRLLKGKVTGVELARRYNVTTATISNVLNNKFKKV